jgi:hypothetical protein
MPKPKAEIVAGKRMRGTRAHAITKEKPATGQRGAKEPRPEIRTNKHRGVYEVVGHGFRGFAYHPSTRKLESFGIFATDVLAAYRVDMRLKQLAQELRKPSMLKSLNYDDKGAFIFKQAKLGLKGFAWHKATQMWHAYIQIDGKQKSLGYFAAGDQVEAAMAYDAEALKIGRKTNFEYDKLGNRIE